jgi:carbon storage regulator
MVGEAQLTKIVEFTPQKDQEDHAMLVLSRKTDERIIIDERITITILEVRGNQIRIGIEAPKEMPVLREELTVRKAATVTAA